MQKEKFFADMKKNHEFNQSRFLRATRFQFCLSLYFSFLNVNMESTIENVIA